jgi:serine/threonine protein kinase
MPQGQYVQASDDIINNHYRLIRQLKQGGMSNIWLADDLEAHDKCVIKIPRFDTPHNPKINEEKINIEADLLRQIKHPHIVGYRDHFRWKDVSHLVLEYIAGEDLFAKVNSTKIEEKKAIKWCVQVLDALEYIHSFKLVHRDINPWNIMVRPNDDLVIVDFGTTKTTAIDGATMITKSGFEIPEQAARGYADERSDIYGAGSVLFYLLTGTPPGLINTHDISSLLIEKYAVSARLAKCVEQALQLDASKRFQGAKAMRVALLSAARN